MKKSNNSKTNNSKANNSKKIIGIILIVMAALIAIFIIASVIESNDFQFGRDDAGRDDAGREELFYIGNDDMYEILNDRSGEGFFVYIGRPTCPNCREFEPVLRETLQSLGGEMRYFQTDIARESDDVSAMTTIDILNLINVPGVPSTVFIVNGEVVDRLGNSERTPEGLNAFFEANGGLN